MSEDEIKKNIDKIIDNYNTFLDDEEFGDYYEREWAEFELKTMTAFLDLYQKEKEKNEELQELYTGALKDWCKEKEKNKRQAEHIQNINKRNENLRIHLKLLQAHRLKKYMMDNYISKDKIREKMEEVKNLSTAGYEILKELLEEE